MPSGHHVALNSGGLHLLNQLTYADDLMAGRPQSTTTETHPPPLVLETDHCPHGLCSSSALVTLTFPRILQYIGIAIFATSHLVCNTSGFEFHYCIFSTASLKCSKTHLLCLGRNRINPISYVTLLVMGGWLSPQALTRAIQLLRHPAPHFSLLVVMSYFYYIVTDFV